MRWWMAGMDTVVVRLRQRLECAQCAVSRSNLVVAGCGE
jgi:hypothetical protein